MLNTRAGTLPAYVSFIWMLTVLAEHFPASIPFAECQLTLQDSKQPSRPIAGP